MSRGSEVFLDGRLLVFVRTVRKFRPNQEGCWRRMKIFETKGFGVLIDGDRWWRIGNVRAHSCGPFIHLVAMRPGDVWLESSIQRMMGGETADQST